MCVCVYVCVLLWALIGYCVVNRAQNHCFFKVIGLLCFELPVLDCVEFSESWLCHGVAMFSKSSYITYSRLSALKNAVANDGWFFSSWLRFVDCSWKSTCGLLQLANSWQRDAVLLESEQSHCQLECSSRKKSLTNKMHMNAIHQGRKNNARRHVVCC